MLVAHLFHRLITTWVSIVVVTWKVMKFLENKTDHDLFAIKTESVKQSMKSYTAALLIVHDQWKMVLSSDKWLTIDLWLILLNAYWLFCTASLARIFYISEGMLSESGLRSWIVGMSDIAQSHTQLLIMVDNLKVGLEFDCLCFLHDENNCCIWSPWRPCLPLRRRSSYW